MTQLRHFFIKEFKSYFEAPIFSVFMIIFLLLSGVFTFYVSGFYENENADLSSFFEWHLWLFLFLIPALTMRLWAEEKQNGTFELLLTSPIHPVTMVVAKFLAAWTIVFLTLMGTLPLWLTVSYLGNPDHGVILSGYIASFLSAGVFLSIGMSLSALTNHQVTAFILTISVCFMMMVTGLSMIQSFFESLHMPQWFLDTLSHLSVLTHYHDVSHGLIAMNSVIFYGSLISLGVFINVILIQQVFLRKLRAVLGIICLLMVVNALSAMFLSKWRIDLTDDQRYQLSNGTIEMLQALPSDIDIKVYYSNAMANGLPLLKGYATRVKRFLQDYRIYSHNKIHVTWVDPKPFSKDEEDALAFGIKSVPINEKGGKAFFGIVATNRYNEQRTIPVLSFERESFLEYDISRMVYDLITVKKPKVVVVSSLPVGEQSLLGLPIPQLKASRAWLFIQYLQQLVNITILPNDAKTLPSDTNVLLVIQPSSEINESLFDSIDQYIRGGHHTILFLDPHASSTGTGGTREHHYDRRFDGLLIRYGVSIEKQVIVADRIAARKVKDSELDIVLDDVTKLSLSENNMNKKDITLNHLKELNLQTVGSIRATKMAGVSIEPLLMSNRQSMAMPISYVNKPTKADTLLSEFTSQDREHLLAVRVSGDANIVVIADSDLLSNEQWAKVEMYEDHQIVNPIADNAAFITNIVDHYSSGSKLVNLSGRGAQIRPFTRLNKLRIQSQEIYIKKQKELEERLSITEKKLAQLKERANTNQENIRDIKNAQEYQIKQFGQDMQETQRQLRKLEQVLYLDIESLGKRIKIINILVMPLVLSVFFIFWFRRRGRKSMTH